MQELISITIPRKLTEILISDSQGKAEMVYEILENNADKIQMMVVGYHLLKKQGCLI